MDSFVSTIQHGISSFFETGTQALLSFAFRLVIAFVVWFICFRLIKWFCKKPLLKILEKSPITHAVAIGASLQGSLSNFAGGLLILIFKPFKKGDYIIAGSNEGYVHSVNVLYTNLRTLDNKGVTLPNGSLANSNVTNFQAEKERRLDIDFRAAFFQMQELVMDAVAANGIDIANNQVDLHIKSGDSRVVKELKK